MNQSLFTAVNTWLGSWYELALELGPRSDDRLQAALTALWSYPDLEGCYLSPEKEPSDQPRVPATNYDDYSLLRGVARLPDGSHTACGSCVVREENGGSDWLDLYIPTGALGNIYPSGTNPHRTQADCYGPQRDEIENWFAAIGLWVARSVSFQLGLIGDGVSGCVHAADVMREGIPTARRIGYLWPTGDSVVYHRRTEDW